MDHHGRVRKIVRRNAAKRWTADEDATLRALVVESAPDAGGEVISWVDVSAHLSGRTNKDSRRRWTKIKNNFNKGIWSREEDESLRTAVERFGQRWTLVTEVVETRSPDHQECQKRWRNALDPKIRGSASWSSEEDQHLRAVVSELGKNWSQISDLRFPNRSPLSLSNRYAFFDQHSRTTMPLASEVYAFDPYAPLKSSIMASPHNKAFADHSSQISEAFSAIGTLPSHNLFDSTHSSSMVSHEDQVAWHDIAGGFEHSRILAPHLQNAASVATHLAQECVPFPVDSPFTHATSTLTVHSEFPSCNTLQALPCVEPDQHSSSAKNSVLVLENLDEQTRYAVLHLLWNKTSRAVVRLE